MPKLVNLTPHAIVLRLPDGKDMVLPPSGQIARCSPGLSALDEAAGLPVPVYRAGDAGPVTGLPDAVPGTVLVVSGMVLAHPALAERRDVLAPGTGPADGAIRDEAGRIVAVTRLVGRP